MKKYIIIVTTSNSKKNCDKIKDKILSQKLSPCIYIIPSIESSYLWKGKIVSDSESLILIKSNKLNKQKIKKILEEIHCYDIPELISIDFEMLSAKYKEWFDQTSI